MKIYRVITVGLLLVCVSTIATSCFRNSNLQKLDKILKSGNEALLSKQYDKAIREFDSGLTIIPGEPVFLTNKSVALRMRGVDRFNTSIPLNVERDKTAGMDIAKQDFRDSATIATEAVNQIKSMKFIPILDADSFENAKLNAFASRAESMRILASNADVAQADEALAAIHEYIENEPDKTKKLKAKLDAGKMLINTVKGEQAVIEYKEILASEPNNIEALLGVGLALAQSGDKVKFRESEIYLRQFDNQAPENHPSKALVKDILDSRKQKGVKP